MEEAPEGWRRPSWMGAPHVAGPGGVGRKGGNEEGAGELYVDYGVLPQLSLSIAPIIPHLMAFPAHQNSTPEFLIAPVKLILLKC